MLERYFRSASLTIPVTQPGCHLTDVSDKNLFSVIGKFFNLTLVIGIFVSNPD